MRVYQSRLLKMSEHYITIDCPPGHTRPDDVLKLICNNFSIDYNIFEIKSKVFGEWTWQVNDNEKFKNKKQEVSNFLKQCYNEGVIRYAEL